MGWKDTRRARNLERSISFNGKLKRQTKCGFCAQTVDTAMHYELDGTCPKRIVYGPPTTEPDDPTFAGDESYKLRRNRY